MPEAHDWVLASPMQALGVKVCAHHSIFRIPLGFSASQTLFRMPNQNKVIVN